MPTIQDIINSTTGGNSGPQSYVNGTENYVPVPPYENTNPVQAPVAAPVAAPAATTPSTMSELERIKQEALKIQSQIPTVGDALGFQAGNYGADITYDQYAGTPVDEKAVRRQQARLFQSEIDATNKIYDEQMRQARIEGQGRLGSGRAIQARGGLLGSDFASAQNNTIADDNTRVLNAVQAERQARIGAIMGKMRQSVADEIAAKRKARQEDAASYVSWLGAKDTRRKSALSAVANDLITQGIDPAEMTAQELAEVAKAGGVSTNEVLAAYKSAKVSADTEAADKALKDRKTNAEISKIDADIAAGKLLKIGEGDMLYDVEKGTIVKNPKTFAPKDSGAGTVGAGGYTPGADPVVDAWVSRIGRGDAKITNVPAKYKNAVVVALEQSTGVTLDDDVATATEIKRLAQELKDDKKNLSNAVGPISSRLPTLKGGSATYQAKVDRLKALISKSNLSTMRGLGSMSNIEFENMQAIGTSLSTRTGEEGFSEELQRIIDTTDTGIKNAPAGGGGDTTMEQQVQELRDAGYSEEDIQAIIAAQ